MKPIPSSPGYFATEGGHVVRRGRTLIPSLNGRGYLKIKVNYGRDAYVHRLVCEAYHGSCPPGKQCRHLDGDRANNKPNNLVWATKAENEVDKIIHGTLQEGVKHHKSMLTENQVIEARKRARNGEQVNDVAVDMGIPYRRLLDAVTGRRYAVIPGAVTNLPKGAQRRQAEARAAGIKLTRKSNGRNGESPQKSPQ